MSAGKEKRDRIKQVLKKPDKKRTKEEVILLRSSGYACCNSYGNNQGCDCLSIALPNRKTRQKQTPATFMEFRTTCSNLRVLIRISEIKGIFDEGEKEITIVTDGDAYRVKFKYEDMKKILLNSGE